MPKVLLVCDATPSEGTGHVMRQITLGAALVKHNVNVELFCHDIPDSLIDRAQAHKITVEKRKLQQSSANIAEEIILRNPDFVVIDGYRFQTDTFFALDRLSIPCLVVDDNGDFTQVPSKFILNQNLHASTALYEKNPFRPTLLLGLAWALIRPEVVEQSQQSPTKEQDSVFIAIGGSDHLGLSSQIAKRIEKEKWKIHIAGGFYTSDAMTPKEMAARMARSSVGIIACGTTVWEACLLGLPIVGLVTAGNQVDVAESLNRNKICDTFDCRYSPDIDGIRDAIAALMDSQHTRESLSNKCKEMIDGLGSDRVAKEILQAMS
jgi:UDP-2,4-diacetamido-2,4,6-trideoxy-beta-L-altropyranose hydrolase